MDWDSIISDPPVLRLDRARTPRAFGKGESLWEIEIRRISEFLERHLAAL